jgi:prepilin signal peptidase PulO-like enzyme (type II secretory pathway)
MTKQPFQTYKIVLQYGQIIIMFIDIYTPLVYAFIFVLGLLLGSYLNSWMWRIHEKKYRFGGRSMCIHCSRILNWYENIPLFSYIFLRGKCRTCKGLIPKSYFLVEFFTGFIFLLVVIYSVSIGNSAIHTFRDLFFSALLIVIFVYDAKYQIILPEVVVLGSIVGLFLNIKYLALDPYNLVFGAIICSGFFLLQFLVSGGKWIGGGDVYLGVMLGLWLGLKLVLVALFISYILGAIIGVVLMILRKKEMSSTIVFGTFLSLGTFISLLWGSQILHWYFGLMR